MPEPKNISEQVAALRRELKLTWDAHEREHVQHEAAHGREHEFAAEAIRTAAKLAQENKTDANEWRASMNDREAKFATKTDIASLSEKIDKLDESATHGADTKFATRADVTAILGRLDGIERAGLVSTERERSEKEAASARNTRTMWTVGIMATVGAVLVNAVLRLSGN